MHLGVARDNVDDDAVADDAQDNDEDVERDDDASPHGVAQHVKVRVVDVELKANLVRPVRCYKVVLHL